MDYKNEINKIIIQKTEKVGDVLLKTLSNGNKVLDYHKIAELGFPINILITERGSKGKTFNSKEFILDEYITNQHKSIWLMNTEEQIKGDLPKFLINNKIVNPKKWEPVFNKGKAFTYSGETFCEMVALSTSEKLKGSRDSTIKYIIYDEFNVGLRQFKGSQTFLIENLFATLSDVQGVKDKNKLQVFIHGNYKTLNTPLLVDWGILYIDREFITIYDENDKPLMLIYVPESSIEKIEEQFKNDWTYQLGKRSGSASHIFENKSAYDIMNGIEILDPVYERFNHVFTYDINGRLYELWTYKKGLVKHYYLRYNKDSKSSVTYAISKKDIDIKTKFAPQAKETFLYLIVNERITFDSIASKEAILSNL